MYTKNCINCNTEFTEENPCWNSTATNSQENTHENGRCKRCETGDKSVTLSVGLKFPLTLRDLKDILYSNDIGYWASSFQYDEVKKHFIVVETENHINEEENVRYIFTPQQLLDEVGRVASDPKHEHHWAACKTLYDVITGNTDVVTADNLIQFAAFGKLVYG